MVCQVAVRHQDGAPKGFAALLRAAQFYLKEAQDGSRPTRAPRGIRLRSSKGRVETGGPILRAKIRRLARQIVAERDACRIPILHEFLQPLRSRRGPSTSRLHRTEGRLDWSLVDERIQAIARECETGRRIPQVIGNGQMASFTAF